MFEEITLLGKVEIERTLFEFEGEPIVFTCKNKSGTRYICVNTGYGFGDSWIIARSSKQTILRMLRDEISILQAISESHHSVFVVRFLANKWEYQRLPFESIDASELPDENEKLQNDNVSDYIQQLECEELTKDYHKSKKKRGLDTVVSIPTVHDLDGCNYSNIKSFKQKSELIECVEG